ncbi:MAG TPA: hypothetical protein VM911_09180 [Pyrinomonadaceae bacterium]|nr:hypothetical protein [Pyrinomonadaceae bacterium]
MNKSLSVYVCLALLLLGAVCSSSLAAQTQTAAPPKPAPANNPCVAKSEHRQFDFWVGEWDVTDRDKKIATSSIQSIVGSCIVFENYFDATGYTGKSFNFFDATLGKWRQTWVDSIGHVSEFVGEYRDGAMRFEGETHREDGRRVLRRMTIFNLGAGRVRQYSEWSLDGKDWKAGYDYTYLRRK